MVNSTKHSIKPIKVLIQIVVVFSFAYILFNFVYTSNRFNFKLLNESFIEFGGSLQALPPDILHLYIIAQNNNVMKFSLEGDLLRESLLHQRAVEFLYSARFDPSASDVFALDGQVIS